MSDSEKQFSEVHECGHCRNRAPMEIVAQFSGVKTSYDSRTGFGWDAGRIYELLLCPACQEVVLRRYYWHDGMDADEVQFEILYPFRSKAPSGLPPSIESAYQAALSVRGIDANAYGTLIGRLLDKICEDRSACGKTLNERLADLAKQGEIPEKLVGVAANLRKLRNVGAHADLGELTEAEVPILDDLCMALLEYVYSAPQLVRRAEERLAHLAAAKKPKMGEKGGEKVSG